MKLSILGSTGSIGVSTLDVVAHINSLEPSRIEIDTLVAGANVSLLASQALEHRPNLVVIEDDTQLGALRSRLAGTDILCAAGSQAVIEAMARPVDKVMAAISGTAGLRPTWAAAEAGHDILLANKESMVCAGPLLKSLAARSGSRIIPVDSEHNAILQCMDQSGGIERMTLTASGGPFRTTDIETMRHASPEKALAHPKWSMGAKNSLDSATLMNKGLELIEAVYLFDIPQSRIDVVIHPQSIIHSLVSYVDGSTIAQMGVPDMRTPIAYALGHPERLPTTVRRLDLIDLARLDFEAPDDARFPALRLARQASDDGLLGTSVFNAANEAAGAAFLSGRCGFLDIADIVERCLSEALDRSKVEMPHKISSVEDVLHVTRLVGESVQRQIKIKVG